MPAKQMCDTLYKVLAEAAGRFEVSKAIEIASAVQQGRHLEQRWQLGLDPRLGGRHSVPHDQRPCQRAKQHLPGKSAHVAHVTLASLGQQTLHSPLNCECMQGTRLPGRKA